MFNIAQDFNIVAKEQLHIAMKWRLPYIISFAFLSAFFGMLFKSIWVSLLISPVAIYQIVHFAIAFRNYIIRRKAIINTVDRTDISISIQQFSHVAEERIYEPHIARRSNKKYVLFYYFLSGSSWRIPDIKTHYLWSKDYHMSLKGLKNISITGDEFYFISLQGYHDIVYVYPCKYFDLDPKLAENIWYRCIKRKKKT